MTSLPKTPPKRKSNRQLNTAFRETNNNSKTPFSKQQSARHFATWYKRMIDDDRQNLTLYLSDDVTLQWFGKTIKTRKKVSFFLKHDMHCSRHDFTTVESIENILIQSRPERIQRQDDSILASPLHSPEIGIPKRSGKRKMDSNSNSPQWADGCKPDNNNGELEFIAKKRIKSDIVSMAPQNNIIEIKHVPGDNEMNNKGDGISGKRKRKFISITPPNIECGQGDCMPSTSGTTSSETSHDTLNAQLPKLAIECNGFIEFTRTRNSRSVDSMRWDRKCKVQISYSEDPLNMGEYIVWALQYSDESKCRRNLLAAFEEASKE